MSDVGPAKVIDPDLRDSPRDSHALLIGGAGTFGMRIVLVAGQFGAVAWLSHTLAPAAFGVFGLLLSSQTLLRFLGAFGLDQIVVREVAGALHRGDRAEVGATIRGALWRTLGLSLVAAAVMAGLIAAFAGADPLRIGGPLTLTVLAMVPLTAVMAVLAAAARSLGRPLLAQMPEVVVFYLILLGGLALATMRGGVTLPAAILSLFAAQTGAVAALALLCLGAIRWRGETANTARFPAKEAGSIFIGLALTAILQRASAPLAFVLLGPVTSGLMDVAFRLGSLNSLVAWSMSFIAAPIVSRLWIAGERDEARRLTAMSSLICGATGIIQTLVFLFAGSFILKLGFGARFGGAWPALMVFSIAFAGNGLFGAWSVLYRAAQRDILIFYWAGISGFAFVAAALASYFGHFGLVGVAVATALGLLVRDGLVYVGALRLIGDARQPYRADVLIEMRALVQGGFLRLKRARLAQEG